MSLSLPYAHLNLRRNPFGDVPLEERGALAVVDVDRWIERLGRTRFALQFRGERGSGKTTHLLAIRERFPEAPYYYFAERAPIPDIVSAPLLFLDETQRLTILLRSRLFRRNASFVIGTHVDHSWEMRVASMPHETVRLHGLTAERLQAVVERRIESARRGPGPLPRVTASGTRKLVETYGHDVRAIEARLYDVFQALTEVRDVDL